MVKGVPFSAVLFNSFNVVPELNDEFHELNTTLLPFPHALTWSKAIGTQLMSSQIPHDMSTTHEEELP